MKALLLFLLAGFTGCASTYNVANLLLDHKNNLSYDDVVVVPTVKLKRLVDGINYPSSVVLNIKNNTDEVCELIWDMSGVVDINGRTVEVVRGETRQINELEKQRSHIILPKSVSVIQFYPIKDGDLFGLDELAIKNQPMKPSNPSYNKYNYIAPSYWIERLQSVVGSNIAISVTIRLSKSEDRIYNFNYEISGIEFFEMNGVSGFKPKSVAPTSIEEILRKGDDF